MNQNMYDNIIFNSSTTEQSPPSDDVINKLSSFTSIYPANFAKLCSVVVNIKTISV